MDRPIERPIFSLRRRVALVTGAGQGVGASIAKMLARQGATVAVNDLFAQRSKAVCEEISASGGRAVAAVADVTDPESVREMVQRMTEDHGPVDILVNNAGIPPERFALVPFRDIDPATWDPLIRLNFYAVLFCTREVLGGMCDRGWGRIITISSEAGRTGVEGGCTIYGAAKGAALAFSRNLATEVGRHGVTVNCISLALMESNWVSGAPIVTSAPVPRLGRPADAAAAVAYLASEEADWVTGQTLVVNGGFLCV